MSASTGLGRLFKCGGAISCLDGFQGGSVLAAFPRPLRVAVKERSGGGSRGGGDSTVKTQLWPLQQGLEGALHRQRGGGLGIRLPQGPSELPLPPDPVSFIYSHITCPPPHARH